MIFELARAQLILPKLRSDLESLTLLNCNAAPKECDRPQRAGAEERIRLKRIISRAKEMTYAKCVIVKPDLLNHVPQWPLGTGDLASVGLSSIWVSFFFSSFSGKHM